MKNLANILTISRIVLALVLLVCFGEISVPFLVIYSVAQLTDMVDGTIARKTGSCSTEGAILDTVADVLLVANTVKMTFKYKILTRGMKVWLLISLSIAALSPLVSLIKFKKPYFVHSLSSKILGGVLFTVPFALYLGIGQKFAIFALALFTYSMIENVIMNLLLKSPDADVLTIGAIIKQNRALEAQ